MKSSRTATKWTFWWDCFLNSSFYFGPQLWATWECKCVKLWGTYCMLPSQNVSCQVMLLPCCLKWTWATQEHVVNDSLLAEQPIYQLIFSRRVFSPQSDKITSGPTTPLVCLTLFHVVKWQASLVGCFITTPWLPTIPSLSFDLLFWGCYSRQRNIHTQEPANARDDISAVHERIY